MICQRCNKKFNEKKTDNVCPNCNMYNQTSSTTYSISSQNTYAESNTGVAEKNEPSSYTPSYSPKPKNKILVPVLIAVSVYAFLSYGLYRVTDSVNQLLSTPSHTDNTPATAESIPEINSIPQIDSIPQKYQGIEIIIANVEGETAVATEPSSYYEYVLMIPEGVKYIEEAAFYEHDGLVAVIFPSTLEEIGEFAFYDSKEIEYAFLPESLSYIGDHAFDYNYDRDYYMDIGDLPPFLSVGDYALRPVLLSSDAPESLEVGIASFDYSEYYGNVDDDGFIVVGETLIKYIGQDKNITVPDGVTLIDIGAFYGNEIIEMVILPVSTEHIAASAFLEAKNLKGVNFPENIIQIDSNAFSYCENLAAAILNEGLTTVGEDLFLGCDSLEELYIPTSIVWADGDAFSVNKWYYDNFPFYGNFIAGDDVLFNMYIEHGIETIIIPDGVKYLSTGCISINSDIEEIIIPEGVLTIQYEALVGFENNVDFIMDIPDSVTLIVGRLYGYWNVETEDIQVRCSLDSYAYEYALDNDYQVIIRD